MAIWWEPSSGGPGAEERPRRESFPVRLSESCAHSCLEGRICSEAFTSALTLARWALASVHSRIIKETPAWPWPRDSHLRRTERWCLKAPQANLTCTQDCWKPLLPCRVYQGSGLVLYVPLCIPLSPWPVILFLFFQHPEFLYMFMSPLSSHHCHGLPL